MTIRIQILLLVTCLASVMAAAHGAESNAQPASAPRSQAAKTENKTTAPARKIVSAGVADILKMAEHGVDSAVIKSFVENYPVAYRPSADEVIALHDAGISSDVIAAMLNRAGEQQSKQMAEISQAATQGNQISQANAGAAVPAYTTPMAAPQPAPATQVTYVSPSYTYPTYPIYSYSYALPLFYSSAYCYRPFPYSYSYWPRSYCWPSWPSYSVGFRGGFRSRPGFAFHSFSRGSSHFAPIGGGHFGHGGNFGHGGHFARR